MASAFFSSDVTEHRIDILSPPGLLVERADHLITFVDGHQRGFLVGWSRSDLTVQALIAVFFLNKRVNVPFFFSFPLVII